MPGPKSDKIWADAIRKQVHEYHEIEDDEGRVKKVRYLNLLAANLISSAVNGDMQAMKEVGDRLDGKPQQSVDVTRTKTIVEISDDELVEIIRSRSGNGTVDEATSEEELPSVH